MPTKESKQEAQNPLILRCQRLMECFAKSNDERDFLLERNEGFIVYVDLDKPEQDLQHLEDELNKNNGRYCLIPKLTFYETKKIMEGFVNEKVYDIDTKEKLLDIIQSKEARENFLEFIYDHHSEFEKWQQYYQERSRIRIIEWLRQNQFYFVFEEDLDFTKSLLEKVKRALFQQKVPKDIITARKVLVAKAKTYYSNEALNPRPKRGRPPKQAVKMEVEPQVTTDIYLSVPQAITPFLFTPMHSSSLTSIFSSKFESEETAARKNSLSDKETAQGSIDQKLASLRELSNRWIARENEKKEPMDENFEFDEGISHEEVSFDRVGDLAGAKPKKVKPKKAAPIKKSKPPVKSKAPSKAAPKPKFEPKKAAPSSIKVKPKVAPKIVPKIVPKVTSKIVPKVSSKIAPKAKAKPVIKKALPVSPSKAKKPALRSIMNNKKAGKKAPVAAKKAKLKKR